MKRANYICECGKITGKIFQLKEFIPISIVCECGKQAKRNFNITLEKETDNISYAIQKMLHSSLPSGKDKVVF